MSAINDVTRRVKDSAANGVGNPPVLDPLAGIPSHPFFRRNLKFVSSMDRCGRIRLAALTIPEEKDLT